MARFKILSIAWLCLVLGEGASTFNGVWTEWSECTQSCDTGSSTRICQSVDKNTTPPTCVVGSTEIEDCNVDECDSSYRNEGFGPWSVWTANPDDATSAIRTRECVDELKGCEGDDYEEMTTIVTTIYNKSKNTSKSGTSAGGGQAVVGDGSVNTTYKTSGKVQITEYEETWDYSLYGDESISKYESCEEEVLEDWFPWSTWVIGADGSDRRTRVCKDPSKSCKGFNKEKRSQASSSSVSWEYFYDDGEISQVVEHPEDWFDWGEWVEESQGVWIRTRKCRNDKPDLCRGHAEQKRKSKAGSDESLFEFEIFDKDENPEDWLAWSTWTLEGGGIWSRERKCKDPSGPCRGQAVQKGSKNSKTYKESWDYEYETDEVEEEPFDWLAWSDWTQDVDGSFVRTRACKNSDKGGPCRGRSKRRRWMRNYLVKGEWEYPVDEVTVSEVLDDWESWSAWAQGPGGIWASTRKCKGSLCRGKSTKQRRKTTTREVFEYIDESEEVQDHPEDWNGWSDWVVQPDGSYTKTRSCKNTPSGGLCRGRNERRKKMKVYYISGDYEYSLDLNAPVENPEDWESWSAWNEGPPGYQTSTRNCKNTLCRGKNTKRKRKFVPATTVKPEQPVQPGEPSGSNPTVPPGIPGTTDNTGDLPFGNLEDNMPVDGMWGEWSDWLSPSGPKNTISRKRVCDSPKPSYEGADCLGSDTEIYNETIAIDGNWGAWSPWSGPLDKNNPSQIKRTRQCNNPPPAYGGLECAGDEVEDDLLYISVDGQWSDWSQWIPSETDTTLESRTRSCTNPAPYQDGKLCEGNSYESRTVAKPVEGGWGNWGPWSEPTNKQNPETLTRKRFCDNPTPSDDGKPCNGKDTDYQEHYSPINGNWGNWEEWPTHLPDQKKITRYRKCDNPASNYGGTSCDGPDSQTVDVVLPTDGTWSDWGQWSTPTKKSNPETLIRTRLCNNPAPANNGANCPGEDGDQKEVFYPVNGGWSEWSTWSEPAEGGDIVTRLRVCNNPESNYGGLPCSGDNLETKSIVKVVDGNWGEWEEWSLPDFLTNPETLVRKKMCNNPLPSNGGLACEGSDTDTKEVTRPIDGNWGQWGEWTILDGKDQKHRERVCNAPEPKYDGKPCDGSDTEVQEIIKTVDGGWGEWSQWSAETYLMNPETVSRRRFCENPRPANGGSQCEGLGVEDHEIQRPIDGDWGLWSEWTIEPNTGDNIRNRPCDNPEPMFNGSFCIGPEVDVKPQPKKCPDGYTLLEEGGKCYKLIKRRMNWENAQRACQKLNPNLHLVKINNDIEQNSVVKFLSDQNNTIQRKCFNSKKSNVLVWTGAKHVAGTADGTFSWAADENSDSSGEAVEYTPWTDGAAAQVAKVKGEQCVFFKYPDMKWTFGPCGCSEKGQKDEDSDEADGDSKDLSTWSAWTLSGDGTYVRTRRCVENGNCKGRLREKRTSLVDTPEEKWSYEKDSTPEEKGDSTDWDTWSKWEPDKDGWYIKKRVCKNNGKCRGKNVKRKKKGYTIITKAEMFDPLDPANLLEWSVDDPNAPDGTLEAPGDWETWGEWTPSEDGSLTRTRVCKNPGGSCRGKITERRSRKSWRVEGSWTVDITKDDEDNDVDFSKWGEWTSDPNGWWYKVRTCTKPDKSCTGKLRTIRKKKGWRVGGTTVWNSGWNTGWGHGLDINDFTDFSIETDQSETPEAPEDWEDWGVWVLESDGNWVRKRKCKNEPAGPCRGKAEQRKRRRKWKVLGSWSVDVDSENEVPDDWEQWGAWVTDSFDVWKRTRLCKNADSTCRGKATQSRRKKKVRKQNWQIETLEKSDSSSSDDDDDDDDDDDSKSKSEEKPAALEEDPTSVSVDGEGGSFGNWDLWTQWTVEKDDVWVRNRKCKKPTSICIGSVKQTKRKRTWTSEGSWEIDTAEDNGVENLDDWYQWSMWIMDITKGLSVRTRLCKNAGKGQCRGRSRQVRRKKYRINTRLYGRQGWNMDRDWLGNGALSWGGLSGYGANFGFDLDNLGIDSGSLLDSGFGLGIGIGGLDLDMDLGVGELNWLYGDWEYDLSGELEYKEEQADNWFPWSQWEEEKDGWYIRTRNCKNSGVGAYCEGTPKQRRRLRSWTVVDQWLVENVAGDDGDWSEWEQWTEESEGIGLWLRTRKCKTPGGNCVGKNMQLRKMRGLRWGFGWGWNWKVGDWYEGWGWNWLSGFASLDFSADVSIPDTSPSGWKWSWNYGQLKRRLGLIYWWDWLLGNEWSSARLQTSKANGCGRKLGWKWRTGPSMRGRSTLTIGAVGDAEMGWKNGGISVKGGGKGIHRIGKGGFRIGRGRHHGGKIEISPDYGLPQVGLGFNNFLKFSSFNVKTGGRQHEGGNLDFARGRGFGIGTGINLGKIRGKGRGSHYKGEVGGIGLGADTGLGANGHGSHDKVIGEVIGLGANDHGSHDKVIRGGIGLGANDHGSHDKVIGGGIGLGANDHGSHDKVIGGGIGLGANDHGSHYKIIGGGVGLGSGLGLGANGHGSHDKVIRVDIGLGANDHGSHYKIMGGGVGLGSGVGLGANGYGSHDKVIGGSVDLGPGANAGVSHKGRVKHGRKKRHAVEGGAKVNLLRGSEPGNSFQDSDWGDWDFEFWNDNGPDFDPAKGECEYNMCPLCEMEIDSE